MNKKYAYFILNFILIILAGICVYKAADAKIKTKAYIINKPGGEYTDKFVLKIKAKKGYKVYYTQTGRLSKKKCIKSGKTKSFKIKKNTTMTLYPVKNARKISKSKIKKIKVTGKKCVRYKYTIKDKKQSPSETVIPYKSELQKELDSMPDKELKNDGKWIEGWY